MAENTIDLKVYRTLLLSEQNTLREIGDSGKEAAAKVKLDQSCVGRLSRMDAMQAQAMSIETEQRRALRLKLIAAALRRIDNDEFGDCLDCDEPINPLRLQSDPAARLCIDCASKREN